MATSNANPKVPTANSGFWMGNFDKGKPQMAGLMAEAPTIVPMIAASPPQKNPLDLKWDPLIEQNTIPINAPTHMVMTAQTLNVKGNTKYKRIPMTKLMT